MIELNKKYNTALDLLEKAKDDLSMIKKLNIELIQKKEEEIEQFKNQLLLYEPDAPIPEKHEDFIDDHPLVESLHKKASTGKPATDVEIQEIHRLIDEHFPGFISEIENHVGKMTYKQTSLCILTKLYFIPSEVSILLQMRYQAVSNMRSRIAQKWLDPTAKSKDLDTLLHSI